MAINIGELVFKMSADVARLQTDMQKARGHVDTAMDGIRNAAGIARNALAAVGIGLGIKEFAGMIKGSLEAIDAMRDLAVKTGNTVEALGSLKGAARASRTDMEQVATGLQFLSKNMNEFATTGKGKAVQAFQELGISVVDASGKLRSNVDVMREVAEKLTTMEDKTKAVALAKQLLGKAGANLLPLFEEMIRLGKQESAITNEQGEKAHQFMIQLGLIEARATALKREMALGLMPELNRLLGVMLELGGKPGQETRSFFETVGTLLNWVARAAGSFWLALKDMGDGIGAIAAQTAALLSGNLEAFKAIGRARDEQAKKNEEEFERFKKRMEEMPQIVEKAKSASQGDVRKSERPAGAAGLVAAGLAASFLGSGDASPLLGAQNLNNELVRTRDLGKQIDDVFGKATGNQVRGFTSVRDVVQRLIGDLVRMAQTQIEKSTGVGAGSSLPGIGSVIKDIFAGAFAGGGTIGDGQIGLVGEDGPEIIAGGSGGTSVFPMGGMGGGAVFNIDMRGADPSMKPWIQAQLEQLRRAVPSIAIGAMSRYSYRMAGG